ncbi:amino acid transporter [Rhizophagus irregularis]|uniref:Amino acid/polyamine transporter I n=3 Tax=Rhizophagus irregularis TaxID=588596 RepID=U9TQV0_RHIID|nr:amino acid/polyamine transporter I [Rhizophagus irregularis DAOM 181602=DAOM 197198]EXX79200.1 Mup1p [Rhizophagus irregularis DAOM 197198w]PKC10930.1 amino acid transporter [Rhizophagus irregularis]PKC71274.1 amino acid transporter [Rhizophagus irregularis]PKY24597.1 amino acid transporter [Rhizophagus irregularis]POG68193.1 amino acid/polyamine transporter I [Rhizophagus irregularis DAOM 181602=DAOM 197198]|eukprot:XP_025175059.1 amino acid/polyamine transporter I [Rhizophagus irregularis DAOM 181602=DAOM 197198]
MSIESDKDEITLSNMPQNDEEIQPSQTSDNADPGRNKIFGVFYGIGVNINNVIGSGIVTSPGIIWKMVKSPGIVLLLWVIGGLVSMAGSLTYVELGVIHRISGGETKYLQTAFPNPKLMISYLFSFMYIFAIRPGILSAVLQSAAQYLWYTVNGTRYDVSFQPDKDGWHLPFSPFWYIKIIAVLILLVITLYHMLSNRWANYINQSLAAIKLVTYTIIAFAGICRLLGNWSTSRINWQQSISGNTDLTAYSSSILLIMFSYDGWNSLNYSLDEFRKPEKKLIYSNSISVGIVTLVYLLVNISFISVVPEESINTTDTDETIAATFFRQLFGGSEVMVRIFTALVVLSVVGTAASTVWSGSRVVVAAAASNFFPVYSYELRTWNKHFDTPINALFAQFIWCSLIIFFVGGSFTVTGFMLFSAFSMYSYWIFYFATGVGLLVIRYRNRRKLHRDLHIYGNEENPPRLSADEEKFYKAPLIAIGIFVLSGFFILTFSFVVNDQCPGLDSKQCRIQQLSPILISYGFLLIAVICWYILYVWWESKKAKRIIRIPADEDNDKIEITV